jgi:hypothetical protein
MTPDFRVKIVDEEGFAGCRRNSLPLVQGKKARDGYVTELGNKDFHLQTLNNVRWGKQARVTLSRGHPCEVTVVYEVTALEVLTGPRARKTSTPECENSSYQAMVRIEGPIANKSRLQSSAFGWGFERCAC